MLQSPSRPDRFQVLLLQLADEGRQEALLGDSLDRAWTACAPFLVGKEFPSTYLEFPLIGDPFLDVTLLYDELEPGTRVVSPAAADTDDLFDWYQSVRADYDNINFGFELDTSKPVLPTAAIHFQPRQHIELVRPFLEAAHEPQKADSYLELAARMPKDWPLSFFGLFRGRPGSPLRVCGYLSSVEGKTCANDPGHLAKTFDQIGFSAYDDRMLKEVGRLMGIDACGIDFQFDVYPDGHLGEVFAIDLQFGIEQPWQVRKTFEDGVGARVMSTLVEYGIADERWRLAADAAFARALPVMRPDGQRDRLSFTLMPQWVKARWKAGNPQGSKLYYLAKSYLMNDPE